MPELSEHQARLRPWIAPALGLGLIVGGAAMGLGLAPAYAPGLGAIVAAAVLTVPEWILPARRRRAGERTPGS